MRRDSLQTCSTAEALSSAVTVCYTKEIGQSRSRKVGLAREREKEVFYYPISK